MSSFGRNFHHSLHIQLSFWQLPVQPMTKISPKWPHFSFGVPQDECMAPMMFGVFRRWPTQCWVWRQSILLPATEAANTNTTPATLTHNRHTPPIYFRIADPSVRRNHGSGSVVLHKQGPMKRNVILTKCSSLAVTYAEDISISESTWCQISVSLLLVALENVRYEISGAIRDAKVGIMMTLGFFNHPCNMVEVIQWITLVPYKPIWVWLSLLNIHIAIKQSAMGQGWF